MAASSKNAAAPEEGAPKKSKKKIVIIIIVLLFLGAIGAGISFWFFNLRDPAANPAPSSTPPAAQETESGPTTVSAPPTMLPAGDTPRSAVSLLTLPSVTVNLSDAAGDRYLKLSMDVELSTPDAATELSQQQARVRDAMIILLSSKTHSELASPEGKMQLKNDIAARLNQILGTPRVVRIYFTDFVVN